MRALLVGAACACVFSPVAAQEFAWDGFHAGVIGHTGLQNLQFEENMLGVAAGYRFALDAGPVVGAELHAATGFLLPYRQSEAGAEIQVGHSVGENVLIYGSLGALYRPSPMGLVWNPLVPAVGLGAEYAANPTVTFRAKVEYLIGAGPAPWVGAPPESFRAQGGVLFRFPD